MIIKKEHAHYICSCVSFRDRELGPVPVWEIELGPVPVWEIELGPVPVWGMELRGVCLCVTVAAVNRASIVPSSWKLWH